MAGSAGMRAEPALKCPTEFTEVDLSPALASHGFTLPGIQTGPSATLILPSSHQRGLSALGSVPHSDPLNHQILLTAARVLHDAQGEEAGRLGVGRWLQCCGKHIYSSQCNNKHTVVNPSEYSVYCQPRTPRFPAGFKTKSLPQSRWLPLLCPSTSATSINLWDLFILACMCEQESLGSNITETEPDQESGKRRGLRQRRLLESIPFDKPAKKPLIKCGPSRSPH
ncbi:unnamed protein product [Pleuronectes platessa]|uniref:Uncharacterized protein n=1 Tax=Pleuronectes platessa TaxID=8262 RepID=A0A9N7U4X1_PLEPL|nr:unnamed protein product [Pleuronectes platessa]